jgi:methionyl-tRNA formyltransferase
MKIIFAGTPPFAAAALTALHTAGHEIGLVLSQPDRPSGRGMKVSASAVSLTAAQLGLRVEKPATLKTPEAQTLVREANADIMVVAAYGLLLPQAVLDMPRLGCINIHGSLLPRWRGAAPVQRAIEAGDTLTGIDIMQMEAGLDTGPILLEKTIAIAPDDTSASLFAKLTTLGAEAIVEALQQFDTFTPHVQAVEGVTYAKKIEKAEATINWHESSIAIARRIRAFDPFPGCEMVLNNEKLKVWRAVTVHIASNTPPGLVIDITANDFTVSCGEGALRITNVQRPGGKRINAAEFLRANPISIGAQCYEI